MPKITIRVERSENDFYTSSNVKVCQVPTIGELVDLASLVGVKSRLGHVPVERVHPLSKWRVASHPVIVLKESEISPEVLSKISARWTHYEATYCRRER